MLFQNLLLYFSRHHPCCLFSSFILRLTTGVKCWNCAIELVPYHLTKNSRKTQKHLLSHKTSVFRVFCVGTRETSQNTSNSRPLRLKRIEYPNYKNTKEMIRTQDLSIFITNYREEGNLDPRTFFLLTNTKGSVVKDDYESPSHVRTVNKFVKY